MLTECAAVEIYKMKIALLQHREKDAPVSIWGKTQRVAKLFGVSSRTVKYVWNRQTWGHATAHLWASDDFHAHTMVIFFRRLMDFYLLGLPLTFDLSDWRKFWSRYQNGEAL